MELREISTWRRNSNPPAYLHSEYMKSSRRGLSLKSSITAMFQIVNIEMFVQWRDDGMNLKRLKPPPSHPPPTSAQIDAPADEC